MNRMLEKEGKINNYYTSDTQLNDSILYNMVKIIDQINSMRKVLNLK